MSKHYGYTVSEVLKLTFKQIDSYMQNLRYVIETSKDFTKPPEVLPPATELVTYAEKCGLILPYSVRMQLAEIG